MSYATMEDNMAEQKNAGTAPVTQSGIGTLSHFRISRNGGRPLSFQGTELAMAMSFVPELPYWYEINLYRTNDNAFVVAVRLFHQAEDRKDTVEAWRCGSLEEALTSMEHYDAAADVLTLEHYDIRSMTAAELTAAMLEINARIKSARQHYEGLVGEILSELDAGY